MKAVYSTWLFKKQKCCIILPNSIIVGVIRLFESDYQNDCIV